MATNVKATITLVHGTWAQNAAWTQYGSKLRNSLEKSLPFPLQFETFDWSGKNSPAARYGAAEELASQLRQTVNQHSEASHFVIGHSHGGNVALKAIEIAELFDQVNLVCLSTPFFHLSPRRYGNATAQVAIILGAIASFTFTFMYCYAKLLPSWPQRGPVSIFLMMPVVVVAVLVWSWWGDAAARTASQMSLSAPLNAKLLILRSVGDEATTAISAFQFASWLMAKGVTGSVRMIELCMAVSAAPTVLVDRIRTKLLMLSGMLLGIGLCGLALAPRGSGLQFGFLLFLCIPVITVCIWALAGFGSIFAVFLVASLVGALLPFWIMIVACVLLPIGVDAFAAGLLFEITVEPVPVGCWTVQQIVPDSTEEMNHSSTYEDSKALLVLSEWIADKVSADFKSSSQLPISVPPLNALVE